MRGHSEERQGREITPPRVTVGGPARIGWIVFLLLMVGVIVEYIVSLVMTKNLPLMVIMNIIDASLIMYFFMHITRLWGGREET